MRKIEMPKLDAPGAGLPIVQELFLKHVAFPVIKRLVSWERAIAMVEREGLLILTLVRDTALEQRDLRVLVPRMMGIEDSSRYWSMGMVVDHVLIVAKTVSENIVKLSRGQTLEEKVDISKVKPAVETRSDIEQEYEQFLGQLPDYLERNVVDRHARNCHVHPWFGCLNPHDWLLMLAIHQYIHRQQVMAIRQGLHS